MKGEYGADDCASFYRHVLSLEPKIHPNPVISCNAHQTCRRTLPTVMKHSSDCQIQTEQRTIRQGSSLTVTFALYLTSLPRRTCATTRVSSLEEMGISFSSSRKGSHQLNKECVHRQKKGDKKKTKKRGTKRGTKKKDKKYKKGQKRDGKKGQKK